ncbi:mobilization protein [Acidiphilium acidophilum]|uniref:mobilization protein n=1 Tax=Acidiphilium acidophilum TaxID=76588 RepID=UPI002E8E785E|nr:mobilization protein [Acidiphilium acidophilum]
MARLPIEQRIAQLEARAKALKARMAQQDRAKDTRRKILLGALVLHRLEQSGDGEFSKRLGDWLRRELPGFLTREEDRALFADLLGTKAESPAPMMTMAETTKSES